MPEKVVAQKPDRELPEKPEAKEMERIKAALAELQEREAARDPKWKPKHDLRSPK